MDDSVCWLLQEKQMTDEIQIEALKRLMADSLTGPMTVEELGNIFSLGFRTMKSHLSELDGVVRAGSFYRVPLKWMPPEFIAELQNLTKAED